MLRNDAKIFDDYHTVSRDKVLSLEECNDQFQTKFSISNRSKLAWQDYNIDYEELKMAENVIEGEWLTTRMPSILEYLQKHDAIQQKKRRFVVDTHSGVTDMKPVEVEKVTIPVEDLEVEAEELKMEKITLEDAFVTPAEEVKANIDRNKSYGKTFELAVANYAKEKKLDWSDHIVFVPSEEALESKVINEALIRKHVFPQKNSVIETASIWKKTLNVKNNMYDANDLFVINIDAEKVKVSSIPYIFKEAQRYESYRGEEMYKVNLVGKRHL